MKNTSYIIVYKPENRVVGETWDKAWADKINAVSEHYKAVPAAEWLSSLSGKNK